MLLCIQRWQVFCCPHLLHSWQYCSAPLHSVGRLKDLNGIAQAQFATQHCGTQLGCPTRVPHICNLFEEPVNNKKKNLYWKLTVLTYLNSIHISTLWTHRWHASCETLHDKPVCCILGVRVRNIGRAGD